MRQQLFTVISPVYNVAPYLSEYFESLEAQTIGIDSLEIILIDDGSTDESLAICEEFATRYPDSVRVLHKENGGQASARNLGLSLASTPWICFPDPDDVLSSNFFEAMHAYMNEPVSAEAVLFAGHIIMWDEKSGRRTDTHATSFRFAGGNSTTSLEGKPNFIHGNAVMSLFSRDIIKGADLAFDERLRTRFEDGNFISQYLLQVDEPALGLVSNALYFYRRRASGNSTNQTAHSDPRSYTDVPRHGYLPVLVQAREKNDIVPRWLQWLVIYDILWLLKYDAANKIPTRSLTPKVLSEFHAAISEVMTFIELESVLGFDMMRVHNWIFEALAVSYTVENYVGPVYIGPPDSSRKLIQIRYRFNGDQPSERIYVKGKRVEPHFEKVISLDLLGRTALYERSLWVSSLGVVRLELNGRMQRFVNSEPAASTYKFRRNQIVNAEVARLTGGVPVRFQQIQGQLRTRVAAQVTQRLRSMRRSLQWRNVQDSALAAVLKLTPVRKAYAGAWVLMDREYQANDSAEVLYRWIRSNKPQTKIWFVVRKEAGDWARLRQDGFKLVSYGSYRWKILMLLASNVVSSHIDAYVSNPLPAWRYGRPQWRLSFLQHGVIKGDLSSWLNGKNLDFFATATEAEYNYIAGNSPYKFGPKEVRLTGLPRHDALLEKSRKVLPAEVRQILIAPTWRQYLAGQIVSTSIREQSADFMESDYARAWQALVRSDELREFADEHGMQLVFMPHPNIQPYLAEFSVPDWVETRLYGEVDVQDVISRSAIMLTDYSSIAFNMAYLYRPVVYYQFDKMQYDSEHIEGAGYFDYQRDGFGPVASDLRDVIRGLILLQADPKYAERYRNRSENTFPVRDGKNSERVYKAIKKLDQPLSFSRAAKPALSDSWDRLVS